MKIICILPCTCPSNSNGVSSLFSIYQSLLNHAPPSDIFFVSNPLDDNSLERFRRFFGISFITYNSDSRSSVFNSLSENQFILVRPDDLEGVQNDIHWDLALSSNCISIFNILLAPPFVFANKIPKLSYYSHKDNFFLANQPIMPAFTGLEEYNLFLESELDDMILERQSFRRLGDRSRPLVSVYVGKGIIRPLSIPLFKSLRLSLTPGTPGQVAFIKRSWPASKRNLYSLLASSRLLISFDPFSHIERVATILGTPVLKLCRYNLRELPGVYVCSPDTNSFEHKFESPAHISNSSLIHYSNALRDNQKHLFSIVSSILSASGFSPVSDQPFVSRVIPFSKECLYAFSSQLRPLMPYVGAISMSNITEYLTPSDTFALMNPFANPSRLSDLANSYILHRSNHSSPLIHSNEHGFKSLIFPFLKSLRHPQ